MNEIIRWIRIHYNKVINSIAFIPAVIATSFLLLSWLMLSLDFSESGKHFKASLSWLSLKDASTARQIISTIIGGTISLTVFSFSMVMIVLNQAASQMSNRILNSMINNRFQQVVLGFYIGTIVYALFLLSTIRDISSGIYVPAISIYLLIVLTVSDIFLFIYFLDYVTQTVKYETIIQRVQSKTLDAMQNIHCATTEEKPDYDGHPVVELYTEQSNYFQGIDEKQLFRITEEEDLTISIIEESSTYLTKGSVLLKVYGREKIDDELRKRIFTAIDFYKGQPISRHAEYGFQQLTEVAIRALSPGINDPATAVLSINALTGLFAYRMLHHPVSDINNKEGKLRIRRKVSSFAELFGFCMNPIWQYGREDIYVQRAIFHMLQQLEKADIKNQYSAIFSELRKKVTTQIQAF